MNNRTNKTIVIVAIILGILCCICMISAVAGILIFQPTSSHVSTLSPQVGKSQPSGASQDSATILDSRTAQEMLGTLETTTAPINDLKDIAARLEHKTNITDTVPAPKNTLKLGASQKFWATNTDDNHSIEVSARLKYETTHLYFWIQDGVSYDQGALETLCNTFETKIYPTDREFFGSEWNPGVDNDPHLYILLAKGLGGNLAGYFSSTDEYTSQAQNYSNQHEMFMLNADTIDLSQNFTYGVLAHEFQHMIHWYHDRNEESWLNEGFSELAAFLNGYDVGGFDYLFTENPDLQLTDWPNDPSATDPHYGASFLFVDYFLNRFGDTATQELISEKENGLVSVDKLLNKIQATDPITNQSVTADDLFADWVVTNYLNDGQVGDGRYVYRNYAGAPKPAATETISDCPATDVQQTVSQYGADYIEITCPGDHKIQFKGVPFVGILPVDPHSGNYAFWSNKGDESDMLLNRDFDFTNVSGSIQMSYWTWYDLEKDYDYTYLEASTDGANWTILKTPSGTDENVSGNNYGWGYNGVSNGWKEETIDLSQFAGQKVKLQFEYITDAAVNGEGFMVDDISIPAINYQSNFEQDNGGWTTDGFVRISNQLPQTYRLEVISRGEKTTVKNVDLNVDQSAEIPVSIGGSVDNVTIAISGTTRFTRQPAQYSLTIQ